MTDGYYSLCFLTRNTSGVREYRSYSVNGNYGAYGLSAAYGEFNYSGGYFDVSWWNSRSTVAQGGYASWASNTAGYNKGNGTGYCDNNSCIIFKGAPVTHTEYRYRDRAQNTTYYYYKWDEISDWQDEEIEASEDRDVVTRKLFRTRQLVPVESEPQENGFTQTTESHVSGTLPVDNDLSGKLATVMVYNSKNNDPNESQIQYIGQITIGSDNSYDITYLPKEDLTAEKGDYVVALGIQGADGLINVEVVEAPKTEYTVKFVDGNGEILSVQNVEEGKDAVVPELKPLEGYKFVTWNGSAVNVRRNMTITAIYVAEQYAVAYVDWLNDSITLDVVRYGETITTPDVPTAEGYDFLHWAVEGNDGELADYAVKGNTIVNAVYSEPKSYTVRFLDESGNVLSTQSVAYGKAAVPPAYSADVKDGMHFLGWNTESEWWNVSQNLDVKPLILPSQTAAMPQSSLGRVCYADKAVLNLLAVDGAKIYYTLDGTVPSADSLLYEEEIELSDQDTVIRAVSVEEGKNVSEVLDITYYSTETEHHANWEKFSTQKLEAGKSYTLTTKFDENPGLWTYHMKLECNPDIVQLHAAWNPAVLETANEYGNLQYVRVSDGYEIYWSGDVPTYSTEELLETFVSIDSEVDEEETTIFLYYDTLAMTTVSETDGDAGIKLSAALNVEETGTSEKPFVSDGTDSEEEDPGTDTPGSGTSVTNPEGTDTDKKPSADADQKDPTTLGDGTSGNGTDEPTKELLPAKKGAVLSDAKTKADYVVISADVKNPTVAFKKATNKNAVNVVIPAAVNVDGVAYKVTELSNNAFSKCKKMTKVTIPTDVTKIGNNAFNGCSKLKTITIKSTKLKKIGKNALKGIDKKAVIKVPKKKLKDYKKLFTAKTGFKKTMKIK